MGELIREIDWAANPLGTPDNWPLLLKHNVSMMLKNSFPVLVCWGPDYIQLYNDAFRPINGETKHPQAMGGRARDTYAEIWDTIGPMFRDVMAGQTHGFPNFMVPLDRNGHLEDCYFDFSYSPIADADGKIHGVLVICLETTEKVKALAQAAKAQASISTERDRLTNFFMQAPAGICILDGPDLKFELINPLYQQLFPGRELLGKPLLDAVPEVKGSAIWDILQSVYTTGKTFEGNELLIPLARTTDGPVEDRYFNFIYQAKTDNSRTVNGILVFVIEVTDAVILRNQDIAEKKLAEEKSAKLAAIIESSDDAIISKTLESVITSWNDSAQRIFGYTADEIIGETIYKLIPPDRQTEEPQILATLKIGNRVENFETKRLTKDGRLIDVSVTVSLLKDKEGRVIGLSKIARDITEKKLDEQRKLDFIGMVSHELKTPLTSLNALLQVSNAKLKNSEDSFLASAIQKANVQVKRMMDLINGFLNISRLESGKMPIEKQIFDMEALVREVIEELLLTSNTHFIRFIPCQPVMIMADRDKISSVISNLVSNAIKYSPKGKHIEVKCVAENRKVIVSVKDEGMGIKPHDIKLIFDRYYRIETNHTQHISGFGIGLYLSAEIIKGHKGKIWVESESGKGSTFYFSLPLETS